MKKKQKLTGKTKIIILISGVVLAIILIVAFSGKESEINSNTNIDNEETFNGVEISPQELILNKEQYENQEILIKNVLVPDPNFAYIEKDDGSKERLFIEPKKSEFCLYFDLEGKLQKDSSKSTGWIFNMDKFTCVSTN